MITFLACLLTVLSSPAPVTLEVSAARVPYAVQQIAEATGTDLRAAATLAEDRIAARFRAVPLATVKEKLADALNAEWRVEGPTTWLRRRASGSEATPAAKAVRERVQSYLDQVPALDRFTPEDAESLIRDALAPPSDAVRRDDGAPDPSTVRTPGQLGYGTILRGLGTRAFEGLQIGDRVVYSTSPTQAQRPIPPSAREAMIRTAQAAVVHAEAIERLVTPADRASRGPLRALTQSIWARWARGEVETVLIAITRNARSFQVAFSWYGPGGVGLGTNSDTRIPLDQPVGPTEPLLSGRDDPYRATETARSFAALRPVGGTGVVPPSEKDLAQVQDVLRDLVAHEPLGWGFGEIWRQAAHTYDLDMVAVLPDGYAGFGAWVARDGGSLASLVNGLAPSFPGDVTVADGWLLARGGGVAEPGVLPRGAISAYVRTTLDDGGIRLDPFATLAAALPVGEDALVGLTWANLLWPESSAWISPLGLPVVQLYGHLGAGDRRAASAPGGLTLRYGQLTPAVRAHIDRLVFGEPWGISWLSGRPPTDGGPIGRGDWPPLSREPTVAFAGGIPATATLTVRVTERPSLFARRASGSLGRDGVAPLSAAAIAADRIMPESPDWGRGRARGYSPYQSFAVGTIKVLEISGELTEGIHLRGSAQVPGAPASDRWVEFEGLPDDVRTQILAEIEALRKRWREARPAGSSGASGGAARPPQP